MSWTPKLTLTAKTADNADPKLAARLKDAGQRLAPYEWHRRGRL